MSWTMETLARGVVLTVGLLGVARCAPNARVRSLVLTGAMCALLAVPLGRLMSWRLRVPILPAPSGLLSEQQAPMTIRASAPAVVPAQVARSATVTPPRTNRVPSIGFALYLIGALAFTIAGAKRFLRAASARRRAASTLMSHARLDQVAASVAREMGMGATPRLAYSNSTGVPFVAGLLAPTVVLPCEALDWTNERLRAVCLHEFAHIRRRDLWRETMASLACIVHWPNPMVWIAASKLRYANEEACDAVVVRGGVSREWYANELIALGRRFNGRPILSGALAISTPSQLHQRVVTLLSPHVPAVAGLRSAFVSSSALLLAIAAPSTTLQLRASADRASAVNFSDGGYDLSTNSAGLQARWVENGRHVALFLTGSVDTAALIRGELGLGTSAVVVLSDRDASRTFEVHRGQRGMLSDEARLVLQTGARQLRTLHGEHRGFPGSTLVGLPAWTDDPTDGFVQAGWKQDGKRFGVTMRGSWSVVDGQLIAADMGSQLVAFSVDERTGASLRVEASSDRIAAFRDGVSAPLTVKEREWIVGVARTLDRIDPRGKAGR